MLADHQQARQIEIAIAFPALNHLLLHPHVREVDVELMWGGMCPYGMYKVALSRVLQQSQIAQNVKENAERNSFLTEERNAIQRHFQHLKGKMNKFRAEQAKRLGELTQVSLIVWLCLFLFGGV